MDRDLVTSGFEPLSTAHGGSGSDLTFHAHPWHSGIGPGKELSIVGLPIGRRMLTF